MDISALTDAIKIGLNWTFSETGYTNPKVKGTIILNRLEYTDQSTIGEICVDGEHQCWCLEPTARLGIHGPHCIPQGKYEILMQWSTRFQMDTPHIQSVPNRTFIEIHPGNFPKDTEGCILPGETKDLNTVNRSREAYGKLVTKIEIKLAQGQCWLEISGGPIA